MGTRFWLSTCLILMLFGSFAVAASPKKKQKKPPVIKIQKQEEAPTAAPNLDSKIWRVIPSFGLSRWQGTGFWTGIGIGLPASQMQSWVWGFETNLLLVSQGSLFSSLVGGWYFFGKRRELTHSYSLGLMAGPAFPAGGLPGGNAVTWNAQLEGAWNQRLNEFASLRLLFRLGLIRQQLFLQPAIGVAFEI